MKYIHFELTEKRKEEIRNMARIMTSMTSLEVEKKIRMLGYSVSYIKAEEDQWWTGRVLYEERTVEILEDLKFQKDANYAVFSVITHEFGHVILGHSHRERTGEATLANGHRYCPEFESEADFFAKAMEEARSSWIYSMEPIVLSVDDEDVSVIEDKGECSHQEAEEVYGMWYLLGLGQVFGVKTFCKKCNAFSFRVDSENSYDHLERICSSVYRLGTWVRRVAK